MASLAIHLTLAAPPPPPFGIASTSHDAPAPGTPVFEAGLANVTCYRIPSIVQSSSGALVAFAEARRGSCGDGDAHQIASRRSLDGGTTWSEVTFPAGTAGNQSYWTGNPCAVALSSGRLLLFVAVHSAGCVGNCVTGNAFFSSDDEGRSWSPPTDLAAAVGSAGKARTGPGLALELSAGPHKGRILVPASQGTYTDDRLWLSDDGGKSWAPSPNASFPSMDEAMLAQLPNGSVLIMMRHTAEPSRGKGAALSVDGGAHFGAQTYLPLMSPGCQSSIVTIGEAVFYSGSCGAPTTPACNHNRAVLAIRRSDDSAATWPTVAAIDAGPAAYSCLVPAALALGGTCSLGPPSALGDDKCGGVLYEARDLALRFVRFPLSLTHGSVARE